MPVRQRTPSELAQQVIPLMLLGVGLVTTNNSVAIIDDESTIVGVAASPLAADACPQCGTLLWFVPTQGGAVFFDAETVEALWERLAEFICARAGVPKHHLAPSKAFVEDLGIDTLDIIELIMGLEEEFGVTIPDAEGERMRTPGDFMNFVLHKRSE